MKNMIKWTFFHFLKKYLSVFIPSFYNLHPVIKKTDNAPKKLGIHYNALLFLCLFLVLITCKSEPLIKQKTEYILGTSCTISIYDRQVDPEVFNQAFDEIRQIEDKMTINQEASQIISINNNAGIKPVEISSDTFYVIQKGLEYSKLSKGVFDITIGPVVKLWGIGTAQAAVPEKSAILQALNKVGYQNVMINEKNNEVFLKNKGMIIDLGAIAKGYAADMVLKILKKNNIQHCIIDLGGNIYVHGYKPDGSLWKVGIKNPVIGENSIIGVISCTNKAVVTSGVYERYFIDHDQIYHHILNTKTGYPVNNELLSVTIVTDSGIVGDALSTSVFALGYTDGMKLVNSLKNVEAVFITNKREIYLTPGLVDYFKLTDTAFFQK